MGQGLAEIASSQTKVIGDRSELRDYYDLMRIETDATLMMETGLRLHAQRYGIELDHPSVAHIVRALGAFSDVAPDPWLTDSAREAGRDDADFDAVSSYWRRRQPGAADWLTAHLSPN